MPRRSQLTSPDDDFLNLVHAIVSGDTRKAAQMVDTLPALVLKRSAVGATRHGAEPYFFKAIAHYMYAGDTALHMAAAGFRHEIALG